MRAATVITFCVIFLSALAKLHKAEIIYQGFNPDVVPWPLPQQMQTDPTYLLINPLNFKIVSSMTNCSIVNQAIEKYKNILFLQDCSELDYYNSQNYANGALNTLTQLTIKVLGACENMPPYDMNEMYSLKVNTLDEPGVASLISTNEWGALRGLESFSQIVYGIGNGMFAVNSTLILDYPRFPFRGFLLDTSRHFLPIKAIETHLELMAMNKFNVFHWHIVDDQSFPYQSKMFPDLSDKGAYSSENHVYTPDDVSHVINYAGQLGIRVVVEFDTPGHTLSWGKGIPGLLTTCYAGSEPDGSFGPIDPTENTTYTFLSQFFSEVVNTFPDQYLHLGGDEVSFECWKSNPNINAFMESLGIDGDYAKLEEYYITRLLKIVQNLERSYIVWQEVIDNGVEVADDTVVHVWKDGHQQELDKVTKSGLRAILSSCWYLNKISYGMDWAAYYNCDPHAFNGTDKQKQLILGGEACMWGEWVDGTNVISRSWPRGSAVAERLWSDKNVTDFHSAERRLERFRCLLIKRKYAVEPINGPGYCSCDNEV